MKLIKIPELFFKKRNLLIMKNDDDKCFLYCILENLEILLVIIYLELAKEIY